MEGPYSLSGLQLFGCSNTFGDAEVSAYLSASEGNLHWSGSGQVRFNWNNCLNCNDPAVACGDDESVRWCKGASATFTTTGAGYIDIHGSVQIVADMMGSHDDPCELLDPPVVSVSKLASVKYNLTIVKPDSTVLSLPLRIVLVGTGDSHAAENSYVYLVPDPAATLASWDADPAIEVLAWDTGFYDNDCPDSGACTSTWLLNADLQGSATAPFTIRVHLSGGMEQETWSVALLSSGDITTAPQDDIAGGGPPLTCAGGINCDLPGSLPDGVRDWNDLRALEFSRQKYSNDCGFLDRADLDRDGYVSDQEVDGLLCEKMYDYNGDGFLDFGDYDGFVLGLENGDCRADANGDGFEDFFDYDTFVAGFETAQACKPELLIPDPSCCSD